MIYTYSSISAFRQCPRKARLRYIDGLVPLARDKAMYFGSLIHGALEAYYMAAEDARMAEAIDWIDRADADMAVRHHARCMMYGYARAYRDEKILPAMVETSFIHDWSFGSLAGKPDMVAELDGKVCLFEHKTASQISGSYLEKLWMDSQILLYTAALKCKTIKVHHIVYNILRKTQIRQKKAEQTSEFSQRVYNEYQNSEMFHREIITPTDSAVERALADAADTIQLWQFCTERNNFPRNTGACYGNYGSPCAYLPICRAENPEMVITGGYEIVGPHEELRQDKETIPF